MTDKTFDPAASLVMGRFKTVHGHNLQSGTPLVVVETEDDVSAPGEVTEAMARRLFASGAAIPADDHRPTPVETPEQEKARLAAESLDLDTGEVLVVPDDLKGNRKSLLDIAGEEGVDIETDDNKGELIRKIVAHRAAQAAVSTSAVQDPAPPAQQPTLVSGEGADKTDAAE